MLTDKQEMTFQKLKAGELTASEKADFYYRLSGILKKDLEGLKDLSRLLDEIPEGSLKKINLVEAAVTAMDLTEKIVKKLDPPRIRAKHSKDQIVGFSAVKSFRLGPFDDKYYYQDEDGKQELKSIGYSMVRDLTDEENMIVCSIMDHTNALRDLIKPKRITLDCTFEEFLNKEHPALIEEAKSKGVKYRVGPDRLDLENTTKPIDEGHMEEPPK